MKKFHLFITVLILLCFALTACGTTTEDILDAITGNSNLSAEVSTSSSAGGLSSQVPTQSREDSSETSKNNSSMPIYPVTSSNGKNSQSTVNSQSIPTKTESTATVLLIDRSSAMCGEEGDNGFTVAYGKNRLQAIQEAVKQVLSDGVYNKNDYIGIIFFGGNKNTPIEALQLTSASNILGISRAVNMDISAITGGKNYLGSTEWRHALEAATKMLQPFQAAGNKHIFMITDGAGDKAEGESSNLNGYPIGGWKYYGAKLPSGYSAPGGIPEKCYTDFIYDMYGITTSTLNISCPLTPAKDYISAIECNGGTYYAETEQEIKDAIITECRRFTSINANLPETSVSNSSTSTSSSIEPSTSQTPNSSFVGEGYVVPYTPVPDGTSVNAAILIMKINNIYVTSSNYKDVEVNIKDAEDSYKALTTYEKLEVINYQHLVTAREAFDRIKRQASIAEFVAIIDSLPEADSLKNENVDAVFTAKAIYDEYGVYLSENVPNFTSYQQKLMACYNKIWASMLEETYIAQDGNGNGVLEDTVMVDDRTYTETGLSGYVVKKRGNNFPTVSNFFNITDIISSGIEDAFHTYSDSKNTNVKIWQYCKFETISFNVATKGILTLYVRPQNNRTYTIVSDSGAYIFTSGEAEASCVFEIQVSGTVTISADSASGYLCAIKYQYPNLG